MRFVWQAALETQVLDEKDKAQRLQTELDVSEQVQKDFVKLSQTLQVITALHSQKKIRKALMKMPQVLPLSPISGRINGAGPSDGRLLANS